MITDAERQRIYEEETARRQVPHQNTPTDTLSSCIMNCFSAIAILIALAVLGFALLCVKGLISPVY